MANKNACRTYFAIRGQFDPIEISSRLGLAPSLSWKATDLRRDGKPYGFAYLEFGNDADYEVYTEAQLQRTIAPLRDKVDTLNDIREEYGCEFYLSIVPELYVDEIHPALAPSMEVIDFCHATRTKIDIDLYIYPNEN